MVEDFKNASGLWAKTIIIGGKDHCTRSYMLYMSMLNRCKDGGLFQSKKPSYKGCRCDFVDYQDFADWCMTQVGYGKDFYQLDKDLIGDSKTYSKDSCVFIPRSLNLAIATKSGTNGLPPGVYLHKCGKYAAQAYILGKNTYLGLFSNPRDAFLVYKEKKKAELIRLAEIHKEELDTRAYSKLLNFEIL